MPNRLSATIMAQRLAAQYGQYSAPTYKSSGLPPEVSGAGLPVMAWTFPVNVPAPTAFSVLAGTEVVVVTSEVRALPVGPFDELEAAATAGLLFSLTMTRASTTASTTTTAPEAIRIRLRCSDRRAAARCAASFSRRLDSTFVLLALPMLGSSNPYLSRRRLARARRSRACASAGAPRSAGTALHRRRSGALACPARRTESKPSASLQRDAAGAGCAGRLARTPR